MKTKKLTKASLHMRALRELYQEIVIAKANAIVENDRALALENFFLHISEAARKAEDYIFSQEKRK